MENEEKTPSWKSFLYAMAGAFAIYVTISLEGKLGDDSFGPVALGIWGVCFWVGGIGNLCVDRRHARKGKALRVKAAAVIHAGQVWTGRRHAHIMRDIWAKFGAVSISQEAQGFVTSEDKFVDREEAARIALAAGQIQKAKSELFSEDVFE